MTELASAHIYELLDTLSELQPDFTDLGNNEHIFSKFNKFTELAVKYIADKTLENALLEEFLQKHRKLTEKNSTVLKEAHDRYQDLKNELAAEKEINVRVLEELEQIKRNSDDGFKDISDVKTLQEHQKVKEKLQQWESTCEEENLEIQSLKCRIETLEERISLENMILEEKHKRDRLLSEFMSATFKIVILNSSNGDEANLALLSESDDTGRQTWHRLTVSLKDCDIKTIDYLWGIIFESLSKKSQQKHSDFSNGSVIPTAICNISSLNL